MEVIAVTGAPPPDMESPEYADWRNREYAERGALCLKQSAKITALAAQIGALEQQVSSLSAAAAGILEPPPPPAPKLVETPVPEDYVPHEWGRDAEKAAHVTCAQCGASMPETATKEEVLALGNCVPAPEAPTE